MGRMTFDHIKQLLLYLEKNDDLIRIIRAQ